MELVVLFIVIIIVWYFKRSIKVVAWATEELLVDNTHSFVKTNKQDIVARHANDDKTMNELQDELDRCFKITTKEETE